MPINFINGLDPNKIKTRSPFTDLFPIDADILGRIVSDMEQNGYDDNFPITAWGDDLICIDGHTRLKAAKVAGIKKIPVRVKHFKDEEEALSYAIKAQRNRRNLTSGEILRCIEAIDKRKQQGERTDLKGNIASKDAKSKSAKQTADMIGVSQATVERARTVIDHADEETKAAVKSGEKTISKAYRETQQKRKPGKEPVVNKVDEIPQYNMAMTYARMAVADLERIDNSHSDRDAAFGYVIGWIERNRDKDKKKPWEYDDITSADFEAAYEKFVTEIRNAKQSEWEHTSKEAIFRRLGELYKIVNYANY